MNKEKHGVKIIRVYLIEILLLVRKLIVGVMRIKIICVEIVVANIWWLNHLRNKISFILNLKFYLLL